MATFIFIIGILIILGGLAGIFFGIGSSKAKAAAAGVVLLGLILVALPSFTTVDARSVGVQTAMGKYSDTLGPGFHAVAPWSDVEEWTTRNQTIRFEGKGEGEERTNFFTEPRITVRLGTQAEAYVDATVTWRITEKSVGDLWKQHKTFGDARQDFALPAAKGAINEAFDGYDPLKNIGNTAPPATAGTTVQVADDKAEGYIPLSVWSKKVTEALTPLYAKRNVELVSVQVTYVDYDKDTKDKLNRFSGERANTRIAEQKVETAKKEAEASRARATQITPGCEALIRDLAAQDQIKNFAAGVQICAGAGGSGVVVNGSR